MQLTLLIKQFRWLPRDLSNTLGTAWITIKKVRITQRSVWWKAPTFKAIWIYLVCTTVKEK
jgi:hypothetical protein